MTVTTRLSTFFTGTLVGTDQFGNRYYTDKKPSPQMNGRTRRWVIYKDLPRPLWQKLLILPVFMTNRLDHAEPSKVPAEWHGWLHYTFDAPPAASAKRYPWQKPHLPNLTGTKGAYMPPGHLLKGGHRATTTSDYEAWKP